MTSEQRRSDILALILKERFRQETLKAKGRFEYTCADPQMSDEQRSCVLVEEVGEVCRSVLVMQGLAHDTVGQGNVEHLEKELVQVAAVCLAWLEYLAVATGSERT